MTAAKTIFRLSHSGGVTLITTNCPWLMSKAWGDSATQEAVTAAGGLWSRWIKNTAQKREASGEHNVERD